MTDRSSELIHDEVSKQIIGSARTLATERGKDGFTVRDILKDLNITNRVFYNRFHNIDEVLDLLYTEMAHKVRESLALKFDEDTDFFERVTAIAAQTLVLSYDTKKNFSQFVFESDSASEVNFLWWDEEIKKLIRYGKSNRFIRTELDEEAVSYSIWCFIRGFNADAMERGISKENAISRFRYGFGLFLKGMSI